MSDRAEDNAQPSGEGAVSKRRKPFVRAGMAFGIGSAAVVAALLYANRSRRGGSEDKS